MSKQPPGTPGRPTSRVSFAAAELPGVESLIHLIQTDPYSLPAAKQLELLTAWERHSAWLESLKLDALGAFSGPDPDIDGAINVGSPSVSDQTQRESDPHAVEDAACDEVAAALHISVGTARHRIAVARDLAHKLPETRRLLRNGLCSYAQAMVVSDECQLLTVEQCARVESTALRRISVQTPQLTRRSVQRVVTAICPPRPADALEEEFARRDVTFVRVNGVMATIYATLPIPDAMALWNAVTSLANRDERPDDPRTMAHRRADALTSMANSVLDDPDLPVMQGKKRLDTQVVISLETLLGANDDAAEIVGFGPIPAHLARRLATESDTWRRLVTDPVTGHLLDYGIKTYRPPTALREYIIARDRTCQFPGCNTAGWRCDLDHVVPWTGTSEGGQTSADNLITLCRRHHRLKTHNRWRVSIHIPDEVGLDGCVETVVRWTSPSGGVYERTRTQLHEPRTPTTEVESKLAAILAA